MSDLIDFLERCGASAQLRDATEKALKSALAEAGLAPVVGDALLQDRASLEMLLQASPNICCLVNPAREDDDEEEKEEEEEEEEEEEGEDTESRDRNADIAA